MGEVVISSTSEHVVNEWQILYLNEFKILYNLQWLITAFDIMHACGV